MVCVEEAGVWWCVWFFAGSDGVVMVGGCGCLWWQVVVCADIRWWQRLVWVVGSVVVNGAGRFVVVGSVVVMGVGGGG